MYKDELSKVSFKNHGTNFSFCLNVSDFDTEAALQLQFAMFYNRDGERPESFTLDFLDAVCPILPGEREELKKQCSVFYTFPLAKAVEKLFE